MDGILQHFHIDDLDGDVLIISFIFAFIDGAGVALAYGLIGVVTVVLDEFLAIVAGTGHLGLDASWGDCLDVVHEDLLLSLICKLNLHAV